MCGARDVPQMQKYGIGCCRFDSGPGLTLSTIMNKEQLLNYIANLNETSPEEEEETVTKRYLIVVLYGLCENGGFGRDVSEYTLYQFDDLDFVSGLKDVNARLRLNLGFDGVLDTTEYSCHQVS